MSRFRPGTLAMRWRRSCDGDGPGLALFYPRRADGWLLYNALSTEFTKELERRGYDLTTLRFTIRKKPHTSSE